MSTQPPQPPADSTEARTATPAEDATPPSCPPDGATAPEVAPSRAALVTAAAPIQVPGYEILGELGRGGMGAVLRGRDPELGRELAVKVLLERRQDDPRAVQRFVEEAQVGGQLQHPGVVPVYAAGRLPDNRPYFTMKLVQGRTLADLLRERKSSREDLPRFLKIFEQVCQTTAYVHSRGVIHRDLKPLNVMVGAFGEVQVMDWGLAKVVGRGVRTVRSERAEARSETGSVLGTPAYMAPEQACGDVEGLDARCDVFGLGALLCEVLTGGPPYLGRETGELLRKAARGDLSEAFGRLDDCGADAELVRLAKTCLAAEPAERPADAGAVVEAMTAYLTGVQERLRAAELAQAVAEARGGSACQVRSGASGCGLCAGRGGGGTPRRRGSASQGGGGTPRRRGSTGQGSGGTSGATADRGAGGDGVAGGRRGRGGGAMGPAGPGGPRGGGRPPGGGTGPQDGGHGTQHHGRAGRGGGAGAAGGGGEKRPGEVGIDAGGSALRRPTGRRAAKRRRGAGRVAGARGRFAADVGDG